jgi:putative acetyltransferase
MQITTGAAGRQDAIVALFTATFTDSEGADEGAAIGGLVRSLLSGTTDEDLRVVTVEDGGQLVAACTFSRMTYDDPRRVFILSPVAVAPGRQGEGIGQQMLRHGLDHLRADGVDAVLTYGDPAYYTRVGFHPIGTDGVPAPFALSQPEGWLGQSLDGTPLAPLRGPGTCVEALRDPAFW